MIRLTGLLAVALLATSTLAKPTYDLPTIQHQVNQNILPNAIGATKEEIALAEVRQIQSLWSDKFTFYDENPALFEKVYSPFAMKFVGDEVLIGPEAFTRNLGSFYRNAKWVTVDDTLEYKENESIIEKQKYYLINHGRSMAYVTIRHWKKVDGEYKIVQEFIKNIDKLL